MKKLAQLLTLVGLMAFVACGPSAEQIAEQEKAKAIAIAKIDSLKKDSIMKVEQLKTAEAEKTERVAKAAKMKTGNLEPQEAQESKKTNLQKKVSKVKSLFK